MANLPLNLVKQLYYRKKLSTIEIAKRLKVTPWIVQKFMVRNRLPRRTFSEANAEKFKKQSITFSLKRNLSLKDRKLKIAGVMLYWSEGGKSNPENRIWTVDFANSNPQMVQLFLKFLREICGVDKNRLRVLLYCYADQSVETLKKYWSKITKIPIKQFTKPYVRKDFLPEKSGKMKFGLVHIRYNDKKLLLQIEDWIREYLRRNYILEG